MQGFKFVLVLCLCSASNINIGLFVDLHGPLANAGNDSFVAGRIAARRINADPSILPFNTLVVDAHSTEGKVGNAIVAAVHHLDEPRVEGEDFRGVIGAFSSTISQALQPLFARYKVPQVSPSSSSPVLSDSTTYPYFARMVSPDTLQAAAITDTLRSYIFDEVAIVFSTGAFGEGGAQALRGLFSTHKITVKADEAFGGTEESLKVALDAVVSSEAKVIVFWTSLESSIRLLSVARSRGLFAKGYAWLGADTVKSLSLLLHSPVHSPLFLQYNTTHDELADALSGVLATDFHAGSGPLYDSFLEEWYQAGQANLPHIHAVYTYDCVYLYAHALHALYIAHEGFDFNGRTLLEQLKKTEFVGVTGPVKLNELGDRTNTAYDIVNFVRTGEHVESVVVGTWRGGVLKIGVAHNFPVPMWPGNTTEVPRVSLSLVTTIDLEEFLAWVLFGVGCFLQIVALVAGGILIRFRKSKEVSASQNIALQICTLTGLFLGCGYGQLSLLPVSQDLCNVLVWLGHFSFYLTMMPLLIKSYRAQTIFKAVLRERGSQRDLPGAVGMTQLSTVSVSAGKLVAIAAAVLMVDLCGLSLWHGMFGYVGTSFTVDANRSVKVLTCAGNDHPFLLVFTALLFLGVLFASARFAFSVRSIPGQHTGCSNVDLCSVSALCIGCVAIPVFFVSETGMGRSLVVVISSLLVSLLFLSLLFWPICVYCISSRPGANEKSVRGLISNGLAYIEGVQGKKLRNYRVISLVVSVIVVLPPCAVFSHVFWMIAATFFASIVLFAASIVVIRGLLNRFSESEINFEGAEQKMTRSEYTRPSLIHAKETGKLSQEDSPSLKPERINRKLEAQMDFNASKTKDAPHNKPTNVSEIIERFRASNASCAFEIYFTIMVLLWVFSYIFSAYNMSFRALPAPSTRVYWEYPQMTLAHKFMELFLFWTFLLEYVMGLLMSRPSVVAPLVGTNLLKLIVLYLWLIFWWIHEENFDIFHLDPFVALLAPGSFRILYFYFIIEFLSSRGGNAMTVRMQILRVLALIIMCVCTFAGLMFILESSHQSTSNWRYHDFLYFAVVTMSTVGYGDLAVTQSVTRMVLVFAIAFLLVFVPNQVAHINRVASISDTIGSLPSSMDPSYTVLVSGSLPPNSFRFFLQELFHSDHGPGMYKVVLVSSDPASDDAMQCLLKEREFKDKVSFLSGSLLNRHVLTRCRVQHVQSFFVISPTNTPNARSEDALTTARTLALKNLFPHLANQIYVQLLTSPEKGFLQLNGIQNVVSIDHFRYQLTARSLLCPGLNTLIVGLMTSESFKSQSDIEDWQQSFMKSQDTEIYPILIPQCLAGLTFTQLAALLYSEFEITLFGIRILPEENSNISPVQAVDHFKSRTSLMRSRFRMSISSKTAEPDPLRNLTQSSHISLNPGRGYVVSAGEEAYVLAKSKQQTQAALWALKHLMAGEASDTDYAKMREDAKMRRQNADMFHRLDRGYSLDENVEGDATAEAADLMDFDDDTPESFRRTVHCRIAINKQLLGSGKALNRKFRNRLNKAQADLGSQQALLERSVGGQSAYLDECHIRRSAKALSDAVVIESAASVRLRDHVIVCLEPCAWAEFAAPLRSKLLTHIQPLLFLHPTPPSSEEWATVSLFPEIYSMVGACTSPSDLDRAGVFFADKVVLFAQPYGQDMDGQDEQMIIKTNLVQSLRQAADMSNTAERFSVSANKMVCQLRRPRRASVGTGFYTVGKPPDKAQSTTTKPNHESAVISEFVEPENYVWVDSNASLSMAHTQTSKYASGNVWASKTLGSLLVQGFHYPRLIQTIEELIGCGNSCFVQSGVQCRVIQVSPPDEFFLLYPGQESYGRLLKFYIARGAVSLGLYRYCKKTSMYYVHTCPSADTWVTDRDKVFLLANDNPDHGSMTALRAPAVRVVSAPDVESDDDDKQATSGFGQGNALAPVTEAEDEIEYSDEDLPLPSHTAVLTDAEPKGGDDGPILSALSSAPASKSIPSASMTTSATPRNNRHSSSSSSSSSNDDTNPPSPQSPYSHTAPAPCTTPPAIEPSSPKATTAAARPAVVLSSPLSAPVGAAAQQNNRTAVPGADGDAGHNAAGVGFGDAHGPEVPAPRGLAATAATATSPKSVLTSSSPCLAPVDVSVGDVVGDGRGSDSHLATRHSPALDSPGTAAALWSEDGSLGMDECID